MKRLVWLVAVVYLLLLVACQGEVESPDDADSSVPVTIVFDSFRDGNYEIYAMNTDGSDQTRLTDSSAWDQSPACSSDGTKIAFTSDQDRNGVGEIYVMNADGSDQSNVTRNSANDYGPAWSYDGNKIAFITQRTGTAEIPSLGPEIYVMNPDGSDQTRFIPQVSAGELDWSPDGSKLAFIGSDGFWDLYIVDATSLERTKITRTQGPGRASWSPDGTKIVFRHGGQGSDLEIYVVNADGTGLTKLTDNNYVDSSPTWSPDGSSIAFATQRHGKENQEIYVMNPDGSGKRRLTNNDARDGSPYWCAPINRSQ